MQTRSDLRGSWALMLIDVRANLRAVSRDLDDLQRRQLPFATALALNDVAAALTKAETEALDDVFDRPVSFTKRAFAFSRATKGFPQAVVFARPIQAAYIAPEEFDEPQALGQGHKIRTPVDIRLNGSGNIPRGAIRAAIAKGAFMATRGGVNGLWQRMPARKGQPGRLRLLIAFTRPKHVATRLGYHERAESFVPVALPAAFERAMARAIATRK